MMHKFISAVKRVPFWYVYIVGLLVLLSSGYLWCTKVYFGPERVFWSMIENSLAVSSVTAEVVQKNETSSLKQLVQIQTTPSAVAHSVTRLTNGNTRIQTEMIGTRNADFTRYRTIKTDQKNAQGKPLNTSKVVGVWAQGAASDEGELLGQAMLGIGLPMGNISVPMAHMSQEDRAYFIGLVKSERVYPTSFDEKQVTKQYKNGRLQYVYEMSIQTIPYARMMKEFAKLQGLHQLDSMDPNSYQSSQTIKIKLTVDALSRQLLVADNGQGYTQTYKGYGLPVTVGIPQKTISTNELQQRLSNM